MPRVGIGSERIHHKDTKNTKIHTKKIKKNLGMRIFVFFVSLW
jgi:hypothetical protein